MNVSDINSSLDKAERSILNFFMPRRCPFCGAMADKELLCEKIKEQNENYYAVITTESSYI